MSTEGHWFCEHCDKPVALSDDLESPARCPRCHRRTAVWIIPKAGRVSPSAPDFVPPKPASRGFAREAFAAMLAIAEAATDFLPAGGATSDSNTAGAGCGHPGADPLGRPDLPSRTPHAATDPAGSLNS